MPTQKTQKPTNCKNYSISSKDKEFFKKSKWNHLKPAGWYKLGSTEIMSEGYDVVLNAGQWQKVDGYDGDLVNGFEVWRNKKLYATVSKELKKQAEEDKKEAKIITRVDGDVVNFSPKMEKLIVDFGCHETKVRNLMNRLFVEFKIIHGIK
jgi:hypothetical protein